MEMALRYFAVFGGLDRKIDTTKPLPTLIEALILDDYRFYRNEISALVPEDNDFRAVLSGIALGDRRTNSAFKRANISFNHGMKCIDELRQMGILSLESSLSYLKEPFEYREIADKLNFSAPFLRFWFAFISPIFKGIRDGEYSEFFKNFQNKETEFSEHVFKQLCMEVFKEMMFDEKIDEIGSYWDDEILIDLVCKTKSGKIVAGNCKYTNSKLKKSELTKLKSDCEKIGLKPDVYVLCAKQGFSSELKGLKAEGLKLLTCRNFKSLV